MDKQLALTRRAETTHFWFRGFRRFVAPVIADLAAGRSDLTLLDCACGTGHNLTLLRRYGRAFGFDLTLGALRASRRDGYRLVCGDATRIPFASNAFDIATSFDLLQCIPDDVAAVREIARVVRPGGAVVLSAAALEQLRGDHSESWQEFRRYTPETVRRLIEAAGLQPLRVSFMFGSLFPLMYGTRLVQRLTRPYRTLRHDRDIAVPWWPVNEALTTLVRAEAAMSRYLPTPIGSSLLTVARKPR